MLSRIRRCLEFACGSSLSDLWSVIDAPVIGGLVYAGMMLAVYFIRGN